MNRSMRACMVSRRFALRADSQGHDQAPRQPMQIEVDVERFRVLQQGGSSQSCHGVPDTAGTWRSKMRAVSQAGRCAVALGMRGYGET